eukprot:c38461_g1_i1 orf=1-180(+)
MQISKRDADFLITTHEHEGLSSTPSPAFLSSVQPTTNAQVGRVDLTHTNFQGLIYTQGF